MKYRIPSLPCFFNDSAQASFFSVPYSTEFLNEFFFFVAVSSAGLRRRPRPLRPRPRPSARRRRRRRPSPTTRCSTCRACTRSSPPAIPSSSRYGYDFGFRSTATSTAFTNRKNGVDIRHQVDQSSYPFLSPTCTSTHRNSSVFLCHRSLTNANVGCPCFLFRSAAPAAAPAAPPPARRQQQRPRPLGRRPRPRRLGGRRLRRRFGHAPLARPDAHPRHRPAALSPMRCVHRICKCNRP